MIPSSPLAFTFPLLPANTCLLVDPATHIALFYTDSPAACRLYPLSPSACAILLAFLDTYPAFCSYQRLFAALYPLSRWAPQEAWEDTLALRPIRRALAALTPMLDDLGLQMVALRRQGYTLASASVSASQVRDAHQRHVAPRRESEEP